MTGFARLKAIIHMIKFFVPFFIFHALPAFFNQKVFKRGLRGHDSLDEKFFSTLQTPDGVKQLSVRRVISRKSLLDGAKGMSGTFVDLYKLEVDGSKEVNVVVKRACALAESSNFGQFVEGVSMRAMFKTEHEMLSKFAPQIKEEPIAPKYVGLYENSSTEQVALAMELVNTKKGSTDEVWTEDVFRVVLRRVARLHAKFWQCSHKDHPLFTPDSVTTDMVSAMSVISLNKPEWIEWQRGLSNYAKEFIYYCLLQRADMERKRLAATKNHSSVIHGDFHFGNIVVGENEDGSPDPRFVDWQLCSIGNPLIDVATLLCSGSSLRANPQFRENMVRYYHKCLVDLGVSDLDWDTCWQYFRWGFLRLHVWLLPIGVVKAAERGSDLSSLGVTAQSISALIEEMKLLDLLR